MFRRLTATQVILDVVTAVIFFFALGFLIPHIAQDMAGLWGGIAISLLMAGALAVRRLSPALALGIAWVGAILQMLLGFNPMPSNIAILAVLYVTAAYGSRAVFWWGFASALVGATVITLYIFWGTSLLGVGVTGASLTVAVITFFAATFALLLAWTVGALVRTASRARVTRLAQQRAEEEAAAEQERVAIARDMHDVVAHSLAVVIAQADGARYAAASDPAAAPAALATISSTARAALADVRVLLAQLRHSQGDAPQPSLADLEGLYARVRAAGVVLEIDVDPAPRSEPPPAVQLAVYRILQEALTNALRHGDGATVRISLAYHPDRLELTARNGVSAGTPAARSGHGLIGMGERASLVGGTLDAGERDGQFVVHASLPLGGIR